MYCLRCTYRATAWWLCALVMALCICLLSSPDTAYAQTPDIAIEKSPAMQSVISGTAVSFTIVVTNTGNITLTDVVISDPLVPACDAAVGPLASGGTATVSCTMTPTVDITNTATVTATDPAITTTVMATDTAVVDVTVPGAVPAPSIAIDKSSATQTVISGTAVSFTIVVTNTGNITLSDVVVSDPLVPACDAAVGPLASGGTATVSCTMTPTVDITNTATVTATDPAITTTVMATDTAVVDVTVPGAVPAPSIAIDKSSATQTVISGTAVSFTIVVTNTGNITLSDVVVSDPLAPGCDAAVGPLASGGTAIVSCTMTPTVDFINTAIVTATDPAITTTVMATDTADVDVTVPGVIPAPSIAIEKSPATQDVVSGTAASFTIVVTNTGNITLTDVVISDPLVPDCDAAVGPLASGGTAIVSCTMTPTVDFINTAIVTATDPAITTTVMATDTADVDVIVPGVVPAPSIAIEKSPTMQDVVSGTAASFTIVVTNTGNITLTDVVISDPLVPDCDAAVGPLASGGTAMVSCTMIPTADFTNTAVVTATDPAITTTVMATDTAAVDVTVPGVVPAPSIAIDKLPTMQDVVSGTAASFTIVVTNTGNITLTDVVISDPLAPGCDATVGPLGSGDTATVSCTMTPTDHFVNKATVTATNPAITTTLQEIAFAGVSIIDPPIVPIPVISVLKHPPTQTVDSGGVATFTVLIRNIGPVTVTAIALDALVPDCDIGIPVTISPGQSRGVECYDYNVTDSYTNVITATILTPVGNSTIYTDEAVVIVNEPPPVPDIQVIKLPDNQTIFESDTAVFTITVENSGDITLTTTLNDPLVTDCDHGPILLGPGAVETYSCSGSGFTTDFTNIVTAVGVTADGSIITDTDDAHVTILEPLNPQIAIQKETAILPILVGHTAPFTITVQNTGNVTLTGITVSDPLAPLCNQSPFNLSAGQSMTYNCQLDNVSADFTNQITATALNYDVYDNHGVFVNVINPGLVVSKSPDLQQVESGQVANFTIVISNTGDVDLENVYVSDPLSPNCVKNIGVIEAGSADIFVCSVIVTDDFTNTIYVTATAPVGPDLTGTDIAVVEVLDPELTIVKSPAMQAVLPGDMATFTILVTNTGEIDVNNASLSDDLCDRLTWDGIGNGDNDLAVNEAWSYTCEIDNVTAKVFNTAIISGTLPSGKFIDEMSNEVEANIFLPVPSIDVKKSTDTPIIYAGTTVTFVIEVLNDGNVPLSGIDIIDPMCPVNPVRTSNGNGDAFDKLDEGELWTYICVVSNIQDKFVNEVEATGLPLNGALPQVNDIDDARVDVIKPSLSIQKGPAKQTIVAGGNAVFTIIVKNNGNVPMTDVIMSDPQCNVLLPADTGPFNLAVDDMLTFTCTINNVTTELTNHASVTGLDPLGGISSDSAMADVNITHPSIDVQKGPEKQVILSGDDVEFEIIVTNNGDVELNNVSVNDPYCDTLFPIFIAPLTLPPGQSQTFICTVNDVDTHFVNVATASGTAPNGTTVSDDDDARVVVYVLKLQPSLDVSKSPDYQEIPVGSDAIFYIDVTNDGNVAIKDLAVIDIPCDPLLLISNGNGDIFLEVGETWTYQCTVPKVKADFTNTATAQGFTLKDTNKLAPAIASDTADVHVLQPVISVHKTPKKQTIPVGGTATFKIDVTNKGAVPLTDVEIYDPKCLAIVKPTDTILEPGETWEYTCVKPHVEQSFTNVAWASGCIVGKLDHCVQSELDEADVNVIEEKLPTIEVSKKVGLNDDILIGPDGGAVVFHVKIANSSQPYDPVTITSLTDDIYGDLLDPTNPNVFGNTCAAVTILPGASYQCHFTANVLPDNLTDIVTVIAEDDEGEEATGEDDATVGLKGDVNCDKKMGAVDALMILRYDVGLIKIVKLKSCTLNKPSVNLYHCQFTDDGICGAVQALFILRCDVGYSNILCPVKHPLAASLAESDNARSVNLGLENIPAEADGTLVVPIHLVPEQGAVHAATLEVNYDSSVLRPIGCEMNQDGLFQSACNSEYSDGVARLSAISVDGVDSGTKLADLTFEVIGELAEDTALNIDVVTITGPEGADLPVVIEEGFRVLQHTERIFLPMILK